MFKVLFTKPYNIEKYRAAPLVEPRERYLHHFAEYGASRLTLRQIALDTGSPASTPGPAQGRDGHRCPDRGG